jgi:hypothetical protein
MGTGSALPEADSMHMERKTSETWKNNLGITRRAANDRHGPRSNGSDLKLPLKVVSNLLGPLSNGRTAASLSERALSQRQLEWKCSPMTMLPMRDLKFATFLQDNLLVNESMSGAVIIVQSPPMLGVLEKPRNWFHAIALGSVLALDKFGRSLDGMSL